MDKINKIHRCQMYIKTIKYNNGFWREISNSEVEISLWMDDDLNRGIKAEWPIGH